MGEVKQVVQGGWREAGLRALSARSSLVWFCCVFVVAFTLLAPIKGDDDNDLLTLHYSNQSLRPVMEKLAEEFLRKKRNCSETQKESADRETVIKGFRAATRTQVITMFLHDPAETIPDLDARIKCDAEIGFKAVSGDFHQLVREELVALDARAVIVNKANKASELAMDGLRNLLSGAWTDWRTLGGSARGVHIYLRSQDKDIVMTPQFEGIRLSKRVRLCEDDNEISGLVANDPGGIGIVGHWYPLDSRCKRLGLAYRAGGSTEIPLPHTISIRRYPFTTGIYFYIPLSIRRKEVLEFMDFVKSEGQKLIESEHLVAVQSPVPSNDYVRATDGAHRLSMAFEFARDSHTLTPIATREIRFLAEELIGLNEEIEVRLLGFASQEGPVETNRDLAAKRAIAVAAQLSPLISAYPRIHPKALGLATEMPLMENETPVGRKSNRRVEVWISRR